MRGREREKGTGTGEEKRHRHTVVQGDGGTLPFKDGKKRGTQPLKGRKERIQTHNAVDNSRQDRECKTFRTQAAQKSRTSTQKAGHTSGPGRNRPQGRKFQRKVKANCALNGASKVEYAYSPYPNSQNPDLNSLTLTFQLRAKACSDNQRK